MSLLLDGTCFICNDCGDDENNDSNEKCSGPSQSTTASSTCIETTAYTLQALIENEDNDNIVCLASWLANQKNRFGIFSSSQVRTCNIYTYVVKCINSHHAVEYNAPSF